jgi:hypothetical protein
MSKAGIFRCFMLHRVIALTFHGPIPEACEVNHIDGDKQNNRPENLEYITHAENIEHAYANGLTPRRYRGSTNWASRLTEADVSTIRSELVNGASLGAMSRRFHVSKQSISAIRDRITWKHVA